MAKPIECKFLVNQSYCKCDEKNDVPHNNFSGGVRPCSIYYGYSAECDFRKKEEK